MKIGQLGQASMGLYSGIKAKIYAPRNIQTVSRSIKGAIFTNGLIEFGWIYRPEFSSPKIFYSYYDVESATPNEYELYKEVLLSSISWKSARLFELKWSGTDINSINNINSYLSDLTLFNLYLDGILIDTVQNVYPWNEEDFCVGLKTLDATDSGGFWVSDINLYNLKNNEYEKLKGAFLKTTENVSIDITNHDDRFYVKI